MKQIILALSAVMAAAILTAAASAAQTHGGQTDGGHPSREIAGTAVGGPTMYSAPYGAETLTLTGIYRLSALGSGSFVADLAIQSPYVIQCLFCASAPTPVSGTVAFSGDRGSLVGSVGGSSNVVYSQQPHGVSYELVLQLQLGEGTRSLARTNADLSMSYSTGINFYGPSPEGWAFGSISGLATRTGP